MDGLHHSNLVQPDSSMNLSAELIQAVNRTYLLHFLAIDPDKILPPGKSLISVVTQERLVLLDQQAENDGKPSPARVQEQVTKTMQRAFWDTTAEKLSSSDPSEQNTHLKRLLNDLHEAISPLLPPQNVLLKILSLPPPPSIAPLYSFVVILKDVLITLRGRCAPIRDSEIDSQLEQLENLPPMPLDVEGANGVSVVAALVTHCLEAIITIINNMKIDLHDFLLGSMNEEQLRALVMREAKVRERALVIQLWSPQDRVGDNRRGDDIIREAWRSWCRQNEGAGVYLEENRWKMRLLQAIFATKAVSCVPPSQATTTPNATSPVENGLPPQLFFSSASLYKLQDHLQAVVIAASLRSLTRLPPSASLSPTTSVQASAQSFMQRVWALLEAELDVQADREDATNDDSLRLINLEDEVVRARQLVAGTLDPNEEQKLREAVRRTLQPSDPVFSLLQKRLRDALLKGTVGGSTSRKQVEVPELLKAGRSPRGTPTNGKRLKLMISDEEVFDMREIASPSIVGLISPIKGFEDPVLSKAIEEAFLQLTKIVGWTENVWGDLV
ncbi:hypothetical protein D9756_005358 [Leucocoprinus leucothites]|uniref:Uncharacterized protein n=1 Tax=Leucocoprinus leucothites TaxID=201217 RepID=A0A8H5D8G1_9AGAR|nr:hypothetical protein D9756_005358 [Leucoagaricus leucothites]